MTATNHSAGRIGLQSAAGAVSIDPAVGNLLGLEFRACNRTLSPLHAAPWLDEPETALPAGLAPVERRLSGDFLCAPFAGTGDAGIPPHGWPANSRWSLVERADAMASLVLDKRVFGATLTKTVRLAADAPLIYQTHVLAGGTGATSVAHHPMVRMARGGRLFMSPKRLALSAQSVLEPGRNRLAVAAQSADLAAFPASDGGTVDLTDLPIGDAHEDFVVLLEADPGAIGWTALIRAAEDDIVFVLKDSAVLPVTMLWHSNGGRDYAPWNGRHTGVLGIEDGRSAGLPGLDASRGDNVFADHGVPTALQLADGVAHTIAHAIGCVPRDGWRRVDAIAVDGGTLTLTGDGGARRDLPFATGFFAQRS